MRRALYNTLGILEPGATSSQRLKLPWEWRMKPNSSLVLKLVLFLMIAIGLPLVGVAQDSDQQSEGVNRGNYNIKQSIELGYRFTDFTGNTAVYDTFVNLNQGPRILGQSLEMRSLNHTGLLFDDLYLNSYGYGGDPNNVSRLTMYKNKWYNFNATFRRDRNLWNYDLLANPLNPLTSNPAVPITYSPHLMQFTRRMSDFNLTLLPQSRVRFRLGYTRNINEGPSLSTFHEGTDVQLFQDWKSTLNAYQMGVDIKLLPKTNISYDQFIQNYKGDTSFADRNFNFRLANGTPADLGVIFNTAANQPCGAPIANATTNPPTINPTCNAYLTYRRSGPVRTDYPVEQLSFQSSYIKNLDISGRFVYTASDNSVPIYDEFFQGLVTRTRQRQFDISGPASGRRISVSTDFAATYTITPKFRIVDEFRFWNFRIPGQWVSTELSLFGKTLASGPVLFDPATCPPPFTAATCPPHNTGSPADVANGVSSLFLGQDIKLNTVQLEYNFTKRIGARLGYRYRNRDIRHRVTEVADLLFFPTLPNRGACAGEPLEPDGTCRVNTVESDEDKTIINEHSLLMGFWSRPTDSLRLTYDMELMSADNTFTRISPRQFQHYKFRAHYRPEHWLNLGGSFNIYEARNNVVEINHLQHSRSAGFTVAVAPKDRWSVDFGYDYNDIFSQTNICFTTTAPPFGTVPCTIAGSPVPLQDLSVYRNKTHYGYGDLMLKPIKRITLNLGYSVTTATGDTLILNPNAPAGPLQFNYHRPYASVLIDVYRGLSWKAGWGFYDYNEKDQPGDPTGRRSFRGNLVKLSFIYAF